MVFRDRATRNVSFACPAHDSPMAASREIAVVPFSKPHVPLSALRSASPAVAEAAATATKAKPLVAIR